MTYLSCYRGECRSHSILLVWGGLLRRYSNTPGNIHLCNCSSHNYKKRQLPAITKTRRDNPQLLSQHGGTIPGQYRDNFQLLQIQGGTIPSYYKYKEGQLPITITTWWNNSWFVQGQLPAIINTRRDNSQLLQIQGETTPSYYKYKERQLPVITNTRRDNSQLLQYTGSWSAFRQTSQRTPIHRVRQRKPIHRVIFFRAKLLSVIAWWPLQQHHRAVSADSFTSLITHSSPYLSQYFPAGHGLHSSIVASPVSLLNEPGGHSDQLSSVPAGQQYPSGQAAMMKPLAHHLTGSKRIRK